MKHKKTFIIITSCFIIVLLSSIVVARYVQVQPVAIKTGGNITLPISSTATQPVINPTPDNVAPTPTINIPHATAPAPEPQPTPKSPKQTSIAEKITEQYTYYPLMTSNDPGYAGNWAIQQVNAPAAWNITTGNGNTIVAVIDTGFGLNHEDLKNNWYINPNEAGTTVNGDRCWTGVSQTKNNNNCDDDNNGYIDDWRGWNFSLGDNNPMAGRTNPNGVAVSHGTQTAGLAGATGNNGLGIATINWNTKIMPLQALSDDGPGYTSDVVAAIYYAVDNGAGVINLSLGGSTYDPAIAAATDYAYAHNVVVIAAAGNCGTGTEQGCQGLPAGAMSYPALNAHVISVGATDSNGARASFSSYGTSLSTIAPGSGSINAPVWTATNGDNLYSSALYGTSFASPQVASLASLIKSIRPSSSVDDITALLLATATKTIAMNNTPYTSQFGHGIINASMAITVASSLNSTSATPSLLQAGDAVSEHHLSSTSSYGSGCSSAINTYCSIWLYNSRLGYGRYLPYQLANTQGQTGWSWNGNILPVGDWQIRAVQGDNRSNIYYLSSK